MKSKSIALIMILLILLNTLSLTLYTPQISAEGTVTEALSETFSEIPKSTHVNSTYTVDKTDQVTEDSSKQDAHATSKWNAISKVSNWSDPALTDGNSVALVVGVGREKPNSYMELKDVIVKNRGEIINTVWIKREVAAIVVGVPLSMVSSFLEETRDSRLSKYIEPNMKFQTQFVPNDPYWSYQWGPAKIGADWAWNTTIGDHLVLVAVVDTGICYTHEDLAANYVALGYDWVNNDTDPMDDMGHGTHCAGIIAAALNNSKGIAGLAQVRIMAEKGLDSSGYGTEDWLANAIVHAVDQGADIISMSWGGYGRSELLYEAIRYAYDAGVLLVAAAGNEGTSSKLYPAAFDEVIAVAATDRNDYTAFWSNFGDWIELAAPGVDIYSTVPWGYVYASGTSMATPHVSGVAALVWSQFPGKTRDWVRLWLRYTADDLGDPGFDINYGYGRINARKAVEQSPPEHDLLAYSWKTPPYVKPGYSAAINATVLNFGENNESDITVQLLTNGTMVNSTSISFLASGASATVSLAWSPSVQGLYNITLYVVPVLNETIVDNNVVWRYIYVGSPLKVFVLNSAGTMLSEIISTWQTLNTEWYRFGNTMIYIDYTTLDKEDITYEDIAATDADVLIISCAWSPRYGWQFTDSEIGAIQQYVLEGHGLIVTAGTFYYDVPNNNKLAPLLGLNETTTWSSTGTDLLHIKDPAHPLFRNIPNPFIFPLVGTAIPNDGRWDENELVGGTYKALGHFKESAIVTYRGLVYISPWLEVIPEYYHFPMQLLYNAITWTRYVRPEHELIVSLKAPTRLKPGEHTSLNATVSNRGRNNETNVELQLLINGVIVSSETIQDLLVDSSYTMSYPWTPLIRGVYNVTAYAPPVHGEEFTRNNIAKKMVMVLLIVVKKVLVYTDDAYVAPSSRYPIIALNNLGINYTHYIDDPKGFGTALVSQTWDLVIVDHANWYALGNYWTELEAYVRGGGLLVLSTFDIDGSNSEPTTLWDALGVRWVSDMLFPEPVYRWDPAHPMFTFPNTVGDLTSYIEGYSDDGDHVAVTTGTPIAGFTKSLTEGYAGVVVGNVYQTVLFSFLLCEFRFDQDIDGKLDAVELWENSIVYVTTPIEHDITVSLDAPKLLKPGESALLNVTVRNCGSNNETDVKLQLMINGTIAHSVSIPKLLTRESYTLSYLWTPTIEGTYNVTAYAPPVFGENVMKNNQASKFVDVYYWISIFVTEDNWPIPPDYDLDYYMYNTDPKHPIEWAHSYDLPCIVLKATLQIYAYDVDSPDEVDEVYFNGLYVGQLQGADSQWTLNEFTVPASYVRSGFNIVEVYVDRTHVGWWGMMVDWANLIIRYLRPEHELAVYLESPTLLRFGGSSLLNATVHNLGLNNETNVKLQLLINGTIVDSVVTELLIDASYKLSYLWTPIIEGTYNITTYAPPVLAEKFTANNIATKFVKVRSVEGYVLFDQTHGTDNITMYSIWVANLTKRGYWIETHISGPITSTILEMYEVFVVPQAHYDYTSDELSAIQSFVFNGGGLLVIGDDSPWIYTSLTGFAGINWTGGGAGGYTNDITPHSVTGGVTAAYFGLPLSYLQVAPPARDLIRDKSGYIMLAVSEIKAGKVLGIADEQSIDDSDIGYADNLRLANNMIDWMSILYEHDVAIVSVVPSAYEVLVGDNVDVAVVAENQGNFTESFTVTAYASSLNSTKIYLDPSNCIFDAASVYIGYRFNVTVKIHDVTDLFGYQIDLVVNDTMLNITRAWLPIWDSAWVFSGKVTLLPRPAFYDWDGDGYTDEVKLAALLLGMEPTFTGDGLLAIIEFEITAIPPPSETLSCNLTIDNEDTKLKDHVADPIPSIKENGYYALSWGGIPPPPPPSGVYKIGTKTITDLAPGARTTLTFTWNTTGVMPRHYVIWAVASIVLGETDTADNKYFDGIVKITKPPFASFTHSPSFPKPGETVIFNATSSTPDGGTIINYDWDFGDGNITGTKYPIITHTYAFSGFYNVTLSITDSEGLTDSTWKTIYVFTRDIALVKVTPSTDQTYVGRTISINVTILNEGEVTETFDVILYYNITAGDIIGTQIVTDLLPGEYRTLTFLWNTTGVKPCHNYTITAYAIPVLGETDITDNTLSGSTRVKVKLVGDINGDGKIDIDDVVPAALAFGSFPGHPRWDPNADVTNDGIIDIDDIVIIAMNFGKIWTP